MTNASIADAFDELADRLTIAGERPFRLLAYRRAAELFRQLPQSVAQLSERGQLTQLDGVGPAIDEKVRELLATGTFPALERARADVSDTLLQLTKLPGVGPATARKIVAAHEGASYASLLELARRDELAGVSSRVRDALQAAHARASSDTDADTIAWFRRDQHDVTVDWLSARLADARAAGAYARAHELVCDACVVTTSPTDAVRAVLTTGGWAVEAPGADASVTCATSPTGLPTRIVSTSPSELSSVWERESSPAGFTGDGNIPLELRERVQAGTLSARDIPGDLVCAADLRGDLHTHSTWSDGRASIIDMARAARARGDAYLCICDHSAPYAMVGGLTPARVREQAEEIARVNEQLAKEHASDNLPPIQVLRGIELEILADGSLGLDDDTLRTLDWVVASIHTQQRQSAAKLRERMQRVLDNPLVDAIGHPTSRRLLKRQPTALDIDWLIDEAARQQVALEINANPDRLDLCADDARRAAQAGCRMTINTDAHRPSTLAYRSHGVALARRAGITRAQVVNCLSATQLAGSRRRN